MRGTGRVAFAGFLLLFAGFINFIYGIGALDDANVFVNDKRFILDDLNTLGWVLIILGLIQLAGGVSLLAGNTFGRVLGIVGGSLGAIGVILSIGGPTRGGRWPPSPSASTSSTASSSSARTSATSPRAGSARSRSIQDAAPRPWAASLRSFRRSSVPRDATTDETTLHGEGGRGPHHQHRHVRPRTASAPRRSRALQRPTATPR